MPAPPQHSMIGRTISHYRDSNFIVEPIGSTMKMVSVACALTLFLTIPLFAQHLPEGAVPQHYQLTFTPDFASNTFAGEEVIDLKLIKPGNSVTLNAAEIKFNSVSIEAGGP